jgi:hypothetical protein
VNAAARRGLTLKRRWLKSEISVAIRIVHLMR